MRLKIQSYPALGEIATRFSVQVPVTVRLEVPTALNLERWQVALWVSIDNGDWHQQELEQQSGANQIFEFNEASGSSTAIFYTTVLSVTVRAQFTFKLRPDVDEDWTWAKELCDCDDGLVVIQGQISSVATQEPPLRGLDKQWTVAERASQSPGTRLWALGCKVLPSEGDRASSCCLGLGTPWGGFLRWMALVRHAGPWLGPRHGKTRFSIDQDAVMCSFLGSNGMHLVILALSGTNDVTALIQSTSSGHVVMHATNDGQKEQNATVLVSVGSSFDNASAAVMYEARELVSLSHRATDEITVEPPEVSPAWKEDWFDGLGYCTWNSLGTEVGTRTLLHALDDLRRNNINITSLIIDDGWQSVDDNGGWLTFDANPKFPGGLRTTVSRIRAEYPSLQHIAVWHAMIGYWKGISPVGDINKAYKTASFETSDQGGEMLLVAKDDVDRLYNDFYKFLVDAGIDAVKADDQYVLGTLQSASARQQLVNTYLDAWTLASLRHFGYRTISCMSQFPQGLFHSQLSQSKPMLVTRNSDDYFPNEPASHAWHVWANAHNSLLTRYLNVLPDWDMFQTSHEYAGLHAAARCVSGGPIYITDLPGKHDLGLIKQITGVTARGNTVILRPSVVGRSIDHYVGFENASTLRVGSYHGPSGTGHPIMGVFNITSHPVTDMLSLASFTGAVPTLDYVVRAHRSGRVSSRVRTIQDEAQFTVSLDIRGYDILAATPLSLLSGRDHEPVWVGNMGLLDKMTGCAAIVSSNVTKLENGRIVLDTRLKAMGLLGVWVSALPHLTIDDNFLCTILGEAIPRAAVRTSPTSRYVLEIDVGAAWEGMGFHSQWSNEIGVKVYFTA